MGIQMVGLLAIKWSHPTLALGIAPLPARHWFHRYFFLSVLELWRNLPNQFWHENKVNTLL